MPTPIDAVLEQRARHLQVTLDACLNWQERWAPNLRQPGLRMTFARRKLARGTDATARQKRDFLWDVLECCVNDFAGDTRTLHDLLRNDDYYGHARAVARLFRAAFSSRRAKWRVFRYPINNTAVQDAILGRATTASSHSPWRMLTRHRPASYTVATELARRLRTLATAFTTAQREESLPDPVAPATATSRLAAKMARVYRGTQDDISKVLDRFWHRKVKCESYSKHCLDYSDYYYLHVDGTRDDSSAASARVKHLTATERDTARWETCPRTKEQWQHVARNWLCRCFKKCIYTWHGRTTIIHDSRKTVDPRIAVDDIVCYINDPSATMYNTARAEKCFDEIAGDARVAVRMATAGATPREIQRTLEDWEGGLNSLQVFFFVAATAERHMLQECWFDPSD